MTTREQAGNPLVTGQFSEFKRNNSM